ILVFNYSSNNYIKSIQTPFFGTGVTGSLLVCDINNDCNLEIIIATSDDILNLPERRKKLICLDFEGNIIWVSDQTYAQNVPNTFPNGGALAVADFNLDGIAEVFIYNDIFNAQNGIKLIDGGTNGFGIGRVGPVFGSHSSTVAANVDLDDNLELIAGYSVYKVSINNINGTVGNSMIPINLDFNGIYLDGFTSVADIDLDGKLDIIVTPRTKFDAAQNIDVGLYCYTIANNQAVLLAKIGIYKPNTTWDNSGTVSIAFNKSQNRMDLFCTVSGDNINEILSFSYDGTQTLKINWDFPVVDLNTFSGITLFDLNNDGELEILYRDQNTFKIINFVNDIPILSYSFICDANTSGEYPVVADIDNSGQAKICIPCGTDPIGSYGYLTIFGAPPGQQWAPARKIWNQYAYNPLFINDDGSIPQFQKNLATYQNGKYNNFMVQESLIDENGF
ncbi:MAG TPA: hypothetical protein PJ990_16790, partial [Saprospiraceae bacterium]|nr:hypothetical protein [Saprospiraceae bacterium]